MSSPGDASHSGEDEEQEKHSQSTSLNVGNLRRRALLSTCLGELRNGQQPGQQQQQQQQQSSLGSGSLSLSLDSQPPGPSGLNLYHLPTATSSTVAPSSGGAPSTSGGMSRGGAGASSAGTSAGGSRGDQQTSPFLVSPSQDILRSQASQEGDGLGFSSLLGSGSSSHMATSSGAALHGRPIPEGVEPSEIQDLHRHQIQHQSYLTRMNEEGSQDEGGAGETGASGGRGGGGGGYDRSYRLAGVVPGSDSNPSSADELGLAAARRQRREQLDQLSVPSQPSKLVTATAHAPAHAPAIHPPARIPASRDQVVHRTTTESDGSSFNEQALGSKPLSAARVLRAQKVLTGLKSSEKTSSSSLSASSTGQRSSTKPTSFYTEATTGAAMESETDETDDSQSVAQSVETPSDTANTSTACGGSRSDHAVERVRIAAGQPLSSLESESYPIPFSHSSPSESVDSSSPLESRGASLLRRMDVPSRTSGSSPAVSNTAPVVHISTSSSDASGTKVSSSGSEGHVDKVKSKKVLKSTPQKQTESAMVDSPELLGAVSQQTQDLGHQVPRWCDQLSYESEVSPEPKPSRRLSRQESSSSSSDQTSPPSRVPPAKRRREKSRSASCSSDVPKWQKTGETSAQAQPSTYSLDKKSADVTPFKRSIRFSDGTGNPSLQSPTSPTPPHSSSLSYGLSSSASGSSSLSPSSSGKSSLTPSSSAKYPSSSSGSSSSAQPQSSGGNSGSSSSQSGRGASGQSSGSSVGDGGGSGTFTRDSPSNTAALDETPNLETQGGPNDETAVVEQSNDQGTLLDDSIFEGIEDSDVEVESSQVSKAFKSPEDASISVPKNSNEASATEGEYNDETLEYMDVDTQPSGQDTPELIIDYEAAQNTKNARSSSPVFPLQSPMKALSSQQASGGDTNEDESLVQVGIDCSLRLHFSQSQEFCVDEEAKKSQNSDLSAKPEVEKKCEDMEQSINSGVNGAKAEEVKRGEGGEEEQSQKQPLPLDEVAPRQEPLYESLRYDEEDSVSLSCKNASGGEPSVNSLQKNALNNGSQVSEVSQLTSSAGTPFQFQLPRGPLLKPVVSITPPPEDIATHTSSTTTTTANTSTTQCEEGSKEAAPVTVSPSEVDTNFFRRSVTPPLLQEGIHGASQSSQSRKSSQPQKSKSLEPQQMTPPMKPKSKSRHTPLSSSAKKSPCLSLSRKRSGAVFVAARRPLALPGENSTKSVEGFEMGVGSHEEQDSMLSCGLSPSPPPINVPSDSQFEASDSEVIFKITKPPSLNQSREEEAGERMEEDNVPVVAVSEKPPESPASKAGEVDTVGMASDKLGEVESGKTREVVQEPKLSSLAESVRPLTKSPVTISSFGDHAEDMEVENVLRAKTAAGTGQSEKQQEHAAERSRLSISLTASCNVPSSTPTNRSSPVPSVRLQPAGSPVRPLASPVYNPLHSRTPSGYHHPHSPVAALASSEFVSPSRSISAEGLQELRRQVTEWLGKEVEVCELRYVRTVCTVIEERVISSELVQNGVVVPGSGKCWPESSRPYNTQEVKVELVPHESPPTHPHQQHHHQLPHHSSSSLLHPSPAIILSPFTSRVSSPMATYHPHGQFSSPTPASRDLFRIPPTNVPLLSPGSSSHPSPSHMQQSPLSTSHLSTSSLSASHPPSHQHMSSLAVSHRREKSPSAPPLQLSPVPLRFPGQGNGNGNQIETHGSSNGIRNQVAEGGGRGEVVDERENCGHNHRHNSGTESAETPLPITTPPCRETASSSITPFKASTRRSLSTRSRSSPKNIWTTKTQSPLAQSAQEGASTSDGVPREGSTLRVSATPSGNTVETDGDMASGGLGDGLAAGMSSTPSSNTLEAGDAVIARWATDKRWYAAIVKNVKGGRVSVHFQDGEKGNVSQSQVFKQGLLRKDEPVTAGEFEDDPEVHGCFLGFDEEGKNFTLRTSMGEVLNFNIDRFCISHDTALEYTKHSKSSPSARKRLHTPQQLLVNPPSAKRRKKTISASPSMLQSDDDVRVEDFVSLSQSTLFQGYTFFLTQRSKEELYTSSSPEGKVSYDKQKLLNSIVNRNGKVLEVYKGERITDGRYFVISDGFCRTHKYLLGLALAIPCVSHKWIEECIDEGMVVDFLMYRLPAGVPHTSTSSIEWVPQERGKILLGINAYIHHTQSTFKDNWGCLLKLSGATVLPKIPSVNKYLKSQGVGDECVETVIIAELGPKKLPRSITDLRDSAGMKVLGTEWIIQCLIQGKVVEFKPFLLPAN